jgi:hypothetical protein
MPQILIALALLTTAAIPDSPSPALTATPATSTAEVDDPLAEMLGKAVVIWCRPSSLEHGITMLDRRWSIDGQFRSLTARFRWFGFWTETPYTSTVKIEVFTGEDVLKVSSIEYSDNCFTPCEMCKKLGEARDALNRQIREALD